MNLDELALSIFQEQVDGDHDYEGVYWMYDKSYIISHARWLSGYAALMGGPVIEIGTDTGIGAIALAEGLHMCANINKVDVPKVYTFDINETRLTKAKTRAEKYGIDNIEFILGTFDLIKDIQNPVLAFIDGDHSYKWCMQDLNNLADVLHPDGCILLHDYFDPRRTDNHPKWCGVPYAITKFLIDRPDWYGMEIVRGYFCLSRSLSHPFRGWDVKQVLKDIENLDTAS